MHNEIKKIKCEIVDVRTYALGNGEITVKYKAPGKMFKQKKKYFIQKTDLQILLNHLGVDAANDLKEKEFTYTGILYYSDNIIEKYIKQLKEQ